MKPRSPHSLKWSLIRRVVATHACTATLLVLALMGTLWMMGHLVDEPDAGTVEILGNALARTSAGQLVVNETPQLRELRGDVQGLWFVIRDTRGEQLRQGAIPAELARVSDVLSSVDWARLGWHLGKNRPTIRMDRVKTPAGDVQILAGYGGGRLPLRKFAANLGRLFGFVVFPYLAVTTLVTFVAASIVVRRSLAGLAEVAAQAGRINFERHGTRLPAQNVPVEVSPLVTAVNDALKRLDEGYERHKRFLADAAHELRTPIAILQTRAESLSKGPERTRLLEDIARLATLAEQLLDLQRLNERAEAFIRTDIVALGRRVAAELAPLAIAAGYAIDFVPEVAQLELNCDPSALERAVANLVQNAIEHGGRQGTITVKVTRPGILEVSDQGAGVPPAHQARIFEPFYRAQPSPRGAGLGLHLVQEIVRRHGGQLTVQNRPSGGACFRITLPAASAHAMLA